MNRFTRRAIEEYKSSNKEFDLSVIYDFLKDSREAIRNIHGSIDLLERSISSIENIVDLTSNRSLKSLFLYSSTDSRDGARFIINEGLGTEVLEHPKTKASLYSYTPIDLSLNLLSYGSSKGARLNSKSKRGFSGEAGVDSGYAKWKILAIPEGSLVPRLIRLSISDASSVNVSSVTASCYSGTEELAYTVFKTDTEIFLLFEEHTLMVKDLTLLIVKKSLGATEYINIVDMSISEKADQYVQRGMSITSKVNSIKSIAVDSVFSDQATEYFIEITKDEGTSLVQVPNQVFDFKERLVSTRNSSGENIVKTTFPVKSITEINYARYDWSRDGNVWYPSTVDLTGTGQLFIKLPNGIYSLDRVCEITYDIDPVSNLVLSEGCSYTINSDRSVTLSTPVEDCTVKFIVITDSNSIILNTEFSIT